MIVSNCQFGTAENHLESRNEELSSSGWPVNMSVENDPDRRLIEENLGYHGWHYSLGWALDCTVVRKISKEAA